MWTTAVLSKCGSSLLFDRLELNAFERNILNNPKASEEEAAAFFSRFPVFLFLGMGSERRREVVLVRWKYQPIGRVEFLRRPLRSNFWDMFEMKEPQIPVVAGSSGNYPLFSSKVSAAMHHVQDYRDWVSENKATQSDFLTKAIRIQRPELFVVTGKGGTDVSEALLQSTVERAGKLADHLSTYEDMFEFSKEHYATRGVIIIPANVRLQDPSPLVAYRGTYKHRVVDNWVVLPKHWLFEEGDVLTLVLGGKQPFGFYLRNLPSLQVNKWIKEMDSMQDPKLKATLKRFIASESVLVPVDDRSRIQLPAQFAEASGIREAVVFVGAGDRFEIWDPQRYQGYCRNLLARLRLPRKEPLE